MAKLRRMLGDIKSAECQAMMALIQTQSIHTLAAWALSFAKARYLPIYEASGGDTRLRQIITAGEEYLAGSVKRTEIKPRLREAIDIARNATDNPVLQASARALSTAAATITTPTNALGFLFYGSAAVAYSTAGLDAATEIYDKLASKEMITARDSLQKVAIHDEPNPAKIDWNC